MSSYQAFWDVPVDDVPSKTGAAGVMDLSDLHETFSHFRLDLSTMKVIDVGCGTGRLSQACRDYWGYDVAPGMVAYAKQAGVRAALIGDLADSEGADIVCCLSVFTHISRPDRQAYLARFAQLAPRLLVDVLPGPEGDSIHAWTADPADFESDLAAAGFGDFDTYERQAHTGFQHRYYHAHHQ